MGAGKRKIPIVKRETREQRAVSFSKRRHGLFNKAAELCMLSGSQVAVVVSSPAADETIYSFGHNSVEQVFDAFLNKRAPGAVDNETMSKAISLYNEIKELELEQKQDPEKVIKNTEMKEDDDGFWWDSEELGKSESIGELQVIVDKLEKLRENAFIRMNDLLSSKLSASGSSTSAASANNPNGGQFKFGSRDPYGFALASNCISLHGNFENNTPREPDFKFGVNNSDICNAASASNYAFLDENNVISCENNIQETTLECNGKQDYYQNLFATDAACYNNEALLCPLISKNADTNNSANQIFADFGAQNCLDNPALQLKPVASSNALLGQLLYNDESLFCNKYR